MHLQHIRLGKCFLWQRSRLRMSFHKRIRTYAVEKVLTAIPNSEHDIRIAFVNRAKHLVGHEARHLIHEPGTFTKPFFKRVSIFFGNTDPIGDSYHFDVLPYFEGLMISPYGYTRCQPW